MSETFYNLTIARNIQLSRNEKEKSPQTRPRARLITNPGWNTITAERKWKWSADYRALGLERRRYPRFLSRVRVRCCRWRGTPGGVVLGGEGCRTVSTAAPSDDDIAERERGWNGGSAFNSGLTPATELALLSKPQSHPGHPFYVSTPEQRTSTRSLARSSLHTDASNGRGGGHGRGGWWFGGRWWRRKRERRAENACGAGPRV